MEIILTFFHFFTQIHAKEVPFRPLVIVGRARRKLL